MPCVKLVRNYIRDPSGIFSISSLVSISMTSFLAFIWLKMASEYVYIINRKLNSNL